MESLKDSISFFSSILNYFDYVNRIRLNTSKLSGVISILLYNIIIYVLCLLNFVFIRTFSHTKLITSCRQWVFHILRLSFVQICISQQIKLKCWSVTLFFCQCIPNCVPCIRFLVINSFTTMATMVMVCHPMSLQC